MKKFLLTIYLLTLSFSINAENVIMDKDDFLKQALGVSEVPFHKYIILKDDVAAGVKDILKDTYHLPAIKYYKNGNKVGFILEAIGKHEFITTGYVVENNKISDAKVLVYRENYGGEVAYDFFLNQIRGNSLKSKDKLTNRLKNISGATMSVNSMRKLSKLSLFLASKI